MRKALTLAAALVFAWRLAASAPEGDSADAVVKDMISYFNQTSKVLKTIKDKESANAVHGKLKELSKRDQAILSRWRKLNLSREQVLALQQKYKDQIQAAQNSFREEAKRVQRIDGGKEAVAILEGRKLSGETNKDAKTNGK